MNRGWMVVLGAVAACGGTAPVAGDQLVLETGCERLLGFDGARQGGITRTDGFFDLALDGPGYFVINDHGAPAYTRDGRFTLDAQGFLSTTGGARPQAYGDLALRPADLMVGSALAPLVATSKITVRANLSADAPIQVFDPTQPIASTTFSSTTGVFDPLGHFVTVDIFWNKSAFGVWEFHATVEGQHAQGSYPGDLVQIATGTLSFDPNGRLTEVTQRSNWNLPDQTEQLSFSFEGVTQFAGPSATIFISQDGSAASVRTDLTVNQRGEVIASFSSGVSRVLGTLAVANFPARQSSIWDPTTYSLRPLRRAHRASRRSRTWPG
jgi:flagellar hook protein FlgE